jgi:mannose-6-phosphate isomerase-like protein (cupin superfamily)
MGKEVKVVDATKISHDVGKRPNVITKGREGSDKITFKVGTLNGGIDVVESFPSDAVHYMLKGKASIEWEGNQVELTEGMAIFIPAGTKFRYRAEKDHKLLSAYSPAII